MSEDYINYNYKMPVKRQTAVEWLVEQCFPIMRNTPPLSQIIEQAKQMEKEQIIKAVDSNFSYNNNGFPTLGEQYYERNYEKQGFTTNNG